MSLIASEALPGSTPAAVLEAPGQLANREIPVWDIAAYGDLDMVLVKVEACGVCGSDFRYYAGENPWSQHTLGRHIPNPPNIVLGHEYAGTVVAVLDERNFHLLGERVAPVCSKVCGACSECRAGRTRLCPNTVHLGHGAGWGVQDFYPGAYCRYVPSWAATCFPISDELSFAKAAMMDILAVCVHVAEQGRIQPGRPVLCIGAGPAGNGIAQAALAMGASHAVLLDRSPTALEIARRQGLGEAIDTREMSNREVVEAIGSEFGSVFDSVGTAETLDLGLLALGKAGTLVNIAVHSDEPIPLNLMRLGGERSLVTSCNFEVGDYPKALSWLEAGRFRVHEWLTPIGLEEIPERFEAIAAHPNEKGAFKLVVRFS